MDEKVKNIKEEVLSNNWNPLKKFTFDYKKNDGNWETQIREVYVKSHAATILLYNSEQKTVILTRQFRLPSYINGNKEGTLIEACAGLLDDDAPEECARREAEEETGYQPTAVRKLFEAYMTPGSDTEIVHFFVGEYTANKRIGEGGGLEHEGEDIEVLELPFDKAYGMIASGEIKDAKTIMLLQYIKINQLLK